MKTIIQVLADVQPVFGFDYRFLLDDFLMGEHILLVNIFKIIHKVSTNTHQQTLAFPNASISTKDSALAITPQMAMNKILNVIQIKTSKSFDLL